MIKPALGTPYMAAVRRRLRRFATALQAELAPLGHWFDGSCPATGYCLFGERGGCTWNELEGLTQLLRYNHLPAGCCGERSAPGQLFFVSSEPLVGLPCRF